MRFGQNHYDFAVFALRAAYIANRVASIQDTEQVVRSATRSEVGAGLNPQEVTDLTARCHGALLREGALEESDDKHCFVRRPA